MAYYTPLAVAFFLSCTSRHATSQWWQPHELSLGGAFTEEADRAAGFNGATYSGAVGVSWPLGMQREAYKSQIDYSDLAERRNAAVVREVSRLVELEEAAALSDGLAEQDDDGSIKLTAMVTDKTEVGGAPIFFWYAVSAIGVAFAAWLWRRAGLPLPFIGRA
jgi:hypothetical protein